MVAHLVRGKSLECARLRGFIVVAVDGVEQEVTRRTGGADETETRFQLEAKVVAPNGIALSLMTERVRPHATENGKRDCEIKACPPYTWPGAGCCGDGPCGHPL